MSSLSSYSVLKRILDVLLSLMLSIPLVPIVLLVGIAIIAEDGLPIFYRSKRMGKDGEIFDMLKFRSMYNNAPDLRNADGSTFNAPDDARVTRLGKLLRKTSIDELPQIFNVLKGDMSFIGPRPSLPTTPYSQYSDIRKKRVMVKPGITGYSQAYYRNSISQEEKFRYDGYYVDHMSLALDTKIFFATIKSVLLRRGIFNK